MRNFTTLEFSEPLPHVTVITLNRPSVMNAMNTAMMDELRGLFTDYYIDRRSTRCLVLTGSGDKAFCSGVDLKERNGMTDATWRSQHAIIELMIQALVKCPVPIIAAVNGVAFAGGCELALGCDFVYAAEHARFAQTEVAIGIIPGAMGTQNLPRAVGLRRAKELILSGSQFSATDAMSWGLVNKVTSAEQLLPEVLKVAERIAGNAPIAVRQAKQSIDKSSDLDRSNGYCFEIEAYNRTVGTADRIEGVKAFNEKRKPTFRDA
jgi:enoyl-CoA hydratase